LVIVAFACVVLAMILRRIESQPMRDMVAIVGGVSASSAVAIALMAKRARW
jgi:hypothetical protein